MAQFLDSLVVEEISDKIWRIIDHDFRYQSDLGNATKTNPPWVIRVPIGFETDFASIPRVPLIYDTLGDTAHKGATIHDFLYFSAICTRKMADDVLLEAMGVLGMPWWRRWPIYLGVRIGGWLAWNAHRKVGHPKDNSVTQ